MRDWPAAEGPTLGRPGPGAEPGGLRQVMAGGEPGSARLQVRAARGRCPVPTWPPPSELEAGRVPGRGARVLPSECAAAGGRAPRWLPGSPVAPAPGAPCPALGPPGGPAAPPGEPSGAGSGSRRRPLTPPAGPPRTPSRASPPIRPALPANCRFAFSSPERSAEAPARLPAARGEGRPPRGARRLGARQPLAPRAPRPARPGPQPRCRAGALSPPLWGARCPPQRWAPHVPRAWAAAVLPWACPSLAEPPPACSCPRPVRRLGWSSSLWPAAFQCFAFNRKKLLHLCLPEIVGRAPRLRPAPQSPPAGGTEPREGRRQPPGLGLVRGEEDSALPPEAPPVYLCLLGWGRNPPVQGAWQLLVRGSWTPGRAPQGPDWQGAHTASHAVCVWRRGLDSLGSPCPSSALAGRGDATVCVRFGDQLQGIHVLLAPSTGCYPLPGSLGSDPQLSTLPDPVFTPCSRRVHPCRL